jgi:hypothetical protein
VAEELLPVLVPAFETVAVPFPDEPIGVGAVWENESVQREQGMEIRTTATYTLREVKGDLLKVDAQIKRASKKSEIKDKRVPPGTTMEVSGEGKFAYELKVTGVASKVDGEMSSVRTIELSQNGKKMQQLESSKAKYVLESK